MKSKKKERRTGHHKLDNHTSAVCVPSVTEAVGTHAALPCSTVKQHCHAALPCSTVMQHCHAALSCSTAMQHCHAALPCSTAMQHCHAALSWCSLVPQSIHSIFNFCVYKWTNTCTHTHTHVCLKSNFSLQYTFHDLCLPPPCNS